MTLKSSVFVETGHLASESHSFVPKSLSKLNICLDLVQRARNTLVQPLGVGGHGVEVRSIGLGILGLGFKSELSKSTSSVTLTSWNFNFQNSGKWRLTPRLWIELIEVIFDKHLQMSNAISIQDDYSPDCPGKERS